MPFETGQTLSHYRLVEKIGEGGMGVVWRARDTKLGRDVAIKLLPDEVTSSPERLARFEREAQVLASLNHPNIGAIYGVEESGGVRGLVLELVEGADLAQRLAQGPLPVEEVLDVARQIAVGLETAHERGIVHRDLKPGNVKRAPDGVVKILDFGLARAAEATSSGSDLSMSPTLTIASTQAGVILGTAAYMSPEQARGHRTDRRTDIWAFGCVVYELLTGARAFQGGTVSDILAGVLRAEPDLDRLPEGTPARLRRLVERCLRKDPQRRLRDIGDARVELEEIVERPESPDPGTVAPEVPVAAGWRWLPWGLAAALGVALIGSLLVPRSASPEPEPPRRLLASLGADASLVQPSEPAVAISPDGGRLAIVAARDGSTGVFIRDLEGFEERRLDGTDDASGPFFSPDGQWIAFFQEGSLKKVQVTGGPVVIVTETSMLHRGGCWGPDDRIVLAPSITSGILEVSAAGGEARELTTLDADAGERTHRFPQVVPGGRWVIFTVGAEDSPEYYDDARIDAVDRGSGERHTVLEGASMARALPSGHLLYARGGVLFAAPFDLGPAKVTGGAVPVQEGMRSNRQTGAADFDVGLDGTLVFVPGEAQARLAQLVWVDREGKVETITDEPESRLQVALSPDGASAAVIRAAGGANDLWVRDMERGISSRLTFNANVLGPVWSPDGDRIAFASQRDGQIAAVYVIPRDGSREEELLWQAENPLLPNDWTPDGRNLLVQRGSFTGGADLWVLPVEGDEKPYPFLDRDFDDREARISPDGRWLAHLSYQSGRSEIYVRPFPGPGGRWQISTTGGREPRWSRDGRELFFRNGSETLVVAVDTSSGFRADRPRVLFDRDLDAVVSFQYSPSPDGRRFLAIQLVGPDTNRPDIAVVLHWVDELRRVVPSGMGG